MVFQIISDIFFLLHNLYHNNNVLSSLSKIFYLQKVMIEPDVCGFLILILIGVIHKVRQVYKGDIVVWVFINKL